MGNPSISHSVLLQQPVVTSQFVETDQSDVVLPDENDSMDVEESSNDVSLYFILPSMFFRLKKYIKYKYMIKYNVLFIFKF